MHSIISCVGQANDPRLLLLAAAVCIAGVYGSLTLANHAVRSRGQARRTWSAVSVTAAGSTAWASHMIGLLAFRPGMASAFEPMLTIGALLAGVVGLGAGVLLAVQRRGHWSRFGAGVVMGLGINALHYLGQAGYVVTGRVTWDLSLVLVSVPASVLLCGLAMVAAGLRTRLLRRLAGPTLILAIAWLHFAGMAAARLAFDPRVTLPVDAVRPAVMAPVVAGVSLWLLGLSMVGLRLSLRAGAQLRRDRQRVKELAAVALEGLLISDGEMVITANASLGRMCGVDPAKLEGAALRTLLPEVELSHLLEHEERDAQLVANDGCLVPVRVVRSTVILGSKQQVVLAVRDQRERLRTEARLESLAYNDPLTGLANRGRFLDLLSLHVASRRERDMTFAVLMIDLDRLKPVNDLLGHAAGDAVLRIAAARLRSVLRKGDVLSRLGGDEFALIQLDVCEEAAAKALAGRIVELMEHPMTIDEQVVHVGASVGVAFAPRDGDEPAALLHNADLALYAAKADGKGVYRFFDPELDAQMQARRGLEIGLRKALSADELEVHFQPLVEARSGRVAGAEALVRWDHPEKGLIPPADFISLAEETGLIIPLGEKVLRLACAVAAQWPADLTIAVNLSPAQFRNRNLALMVRTVLAETGLAAERLELEITEGVLLADEKATLNVLRELRQQGVRISMDDFGTGYSSLSYLRRFPFDKIKIDRSFVQQLPCDSESAAIVRAIINMGACLGMTTTVEGVETPEQLAFSAAEGCTFVQGYLVSRPLPAKEFARFLAARAPGAPSDVPLQVEHLGERGPLSLLALS